MSVTRYANYTTGMTGYFWYQNPAGQAYDFTAAAVANAGTTWTSGHQILLATESSTGVYTAAMSGLPAGDWQENFSVEATPGTPAYGSDLSVLSGKLVWSGTVEIFTFQNWTINGVNLGAILGSALSGTAAWIAAAFSSLFNVASPTLTCADVNQTGDSYGRIGALGSGLTAVASSANLATLQTTANTINSNVGTAGAGLTALPAVAVGGYTSGQDPGTLLTTQFTTLDNAIAALGLPVVSDSVQSSPTPTATQFAGSGALSAVDSAYANMAIHFTSGANLKIAKKITAYTGATRTLTLESALPAAPSATDTFLILGVTG